MDDNFLGILQREEIIPMPGNHILIENSFLQPFWNIKSLVFDLQIKGLSPILAQKVIVHSVFCGVAEFNSQFVQIGLLAKPGVCRPDGLWSVFE